MRNLVIRLEMSMGGRASNIRVLLRQLKFPLINQHQTLQVGMLYQDTNGG